MNKYFKRISNLNQISEWKSKGLSDEVIKTPSTSDNSLASGLSYFGIKTRVKFDGNCLKQYKITFNHGKIVNACIVYELSSNLNNFEFVIENCLLPVKITKNTDIDKCIYSGYGIGFDSCATFLFPSGKFAQNVIIFGVGMSSSAHIDNKKKDILILGEGPTQGLDGTTLTVEKKYSINFTVSSRKFC